MLARQRQNVINIVAGVNDHGLARVLIANNGAIALQRANRNDLVNH